MASRFGWWTSSVRGEQAVVGFPWFAAHATYAHPLLVLLSQVCIHCNHRLHDVATRCESAFAGRVVHRGLKWCDTCHKFFDRDYVGAFNIGRKGGPDAHPVIMIRGGDDYIPWRTRPDIKWIPNCRAKKVQVQS